VRRGVERGAVSNGSVRRASMAVRRVSEDAPMPIDTRIGRQTCRGETATGRDFRSIESESYDIGNASARC
jgi:hypothetical protein